MSHVVVLTFRLVSHPKLDSLSCNYGPYDTSYQVCPFRPVYEPDREIRGQKIYSIPGPLKVSHEIIKDSINKIFVILEYLNLYKLHKLDDVNNKKN